MIIYKLLTKFFVTVSICNLVGAKNCSTDNDCPAEQFCYPALESADGGDDSMTGQCYLITELNGECEITEQCSRGVSHSRCEDGNCECNQNYEPDKAGDKCEIKSKLKTIILIVVGILIIVFTSICLCACLRCRKRRQREISMESFNRTISGVAPSTPAVFLPSSPAIPCQRSRTSTSASRPSHGSVLWNLPTPVEDNVLNYSFVSAPIAPFDKHVMKTDL